MGMGTVEGVEKAWALPDLSEVATVEPFLAFRAFDAFASGALASRYVDDLKSAMLNEAAAEAMATAEATGTKPKGRTKPPKASKMDEPGNFFEIQIEMGPHAARLDSIHALRIEKDIAYRLSSRIAPLLPAIRAYTGGRGTDPIIAGRLSWLIDRIGQGHKYATQPKSKGVLGSPSEFIHVFMNLWRELNAGLLDIAATLSTGTATATPERQLERIEWGSSTAAFAHIFRTLTERGYFPMPRKGGKENEPNVTAFARILLQAFDVKGEGGKSLTAEQLRVRLADAAPRPLADTKRGKFQIPQAGELIVPKAEELE